MAQKEYSYKLIGVYQLETALKLYFEGHDYFSVVVLAASAEKIFGQLVKKTCYKALKEHAASMLRFLSNEHLDKEEFNSLANEARNRFKHGKKSNEIGYTCDVKSEAEDMLNRAIDNYWASESELSELMTRFQNRLRC